MLPGWKSDVGSGYAYGPDYAMPHAMIVDATGRRYCDDSYWVDIVAKTMDPDDQHLPFFLIFDEQHHQKYGLGVTPPGGDYPPGLVTSAATLHELGEALGIDGAELEKTASTFSSNARQGVDPELGPGSVTYVKRFAGDPANEPNPVLGPIDQAPFHGFRLRFVGTGIGTSGIHIDGDGHVLNEAGAPLDGLYAVGSCAALTTVGTGYNSGIALGRGLTLAHLVSRELTGDPVPEKQLTDHSSTDPKNGARRDQHNRPDPRAEAAAGRGPPGDPGARHPLRLRHGRARRGGDPPDLHRGRHPGQPGRRLQGRAGWRRSSRPTWAGSPSSARPTTTPTGTS